MTLTTNRKRQLSCALILISLLLILFAPCMKINRVAADMVGLGSDLLVDIEDLEEMVGSTRLVRDMRGIFRSIGDGKLSGGDILLDSFRLTHMILSYQTSEFGGDSEMDSVFLLLVLVILFFLTLLGCGVAACVCSWVEKKQKKFLSLVYTGLLLLLIVALFIIQPNTYSIAKVAADPFFALIAAGAAAYIIVFSSGVVPSVPRLPQIGRNPASAIQTPVATFNTRRTTPASAGITPSCGWRTAGSFSVTSPPPAQCSNGSGHCFRKGPASRSALATSSISASRKTVSKSSQCKLLPSAPDNRKTASPVRAETGEAVFFFADTVRGRACYFASFQVGVKRPANWLL